MRLRMRSALIGTLALLTALLAANQAGALTITPSGAYTSASASNLLLTFSSTGVSYTCTSSSVGFTVRSDGTGFSPSGSAVYGGCSSILWGSLTVTQTSAWTVAYSATPLALTRTIPTNGMRWQLSPTCEIWWEGQIVYSSPSRGSPPIATTPSDTWTQTAALRATRVINCSNLIASPGLALTSSGSYRFSRGFTVS